MMSSVRVVDALQFFEEERPSLPLQAENKGDQRFEYSPEVLHLTLA